MGDNSICTCLDSLENLPYKFSTKCVAAPKTTVRKFTDASCTGNSSVGGFYPCISNGTDHAMIACLELGEINHSNGV